MNSLFRLSILSVALILTGCGEKDKSASCSEHVHFANNVSAPSKEESEKVKNFADKVKGGLCKVHVEGHASAVGSKAYNLGISKRRADKVASQLVEHGVDASRIEKRSFGETKMKDDSSEERRVVVLSMGPSESSHESEEA
ncbi:OmpA family protein [Candidatus Nesciobacter abundans]|uniref:OmpA family protein n=1 Tax=Candidatus Nesciobacter abundans TaxID=2601668 RepID=A0A5C0UHC3_9PROT|nr:OmpA family protein [Candidatus Nesciobacter abundans]QEK39149.1 OmpA family protein [Candidatus Nesciobacter abundans]